MTTQPSSIASVAPKLYSVTEATAYLGYRDRSSVLQHVRSGKLRPIEKTSAGYLFDRAELDRFKASLPPHRPYRRRGEDQR